MSEEQSLILASEYQEMDDFSEALFEGIKSYEPSPVCPDCGNYGILQDEQGRNYTCSCHLDFPAEIPAPVETSIDWHDATTTYKTAHIVTFLGERDFLDKLYAFEKFEDWKGYVGRYSEGVRIHFGLEIGYVPCRLVR